MDSFAPVLVVLALAAIALLVLQLMDVRNRLPRHPWAMHCDTCGVQLSTDDQVFRDRMVNEHTAKGHEAARGWVV